MTTFELLNIKYLAHKCQFLFSAFLLPQIRTFKDGNALREGIYVYLWLIHVEVS